MPATMATAAAVIPTPAAIRFLVVCGQRHPARCRPAPGAFPVVSAGGTLMAGVGSVVGSELGSRAASSVRFGGSLISSTLATGDVKRVCRNEENALNRYCGNGTSLPAGQNIAIDEDAPLRAAEAVRVCSAWSPRRLTIPSAASHSDAPRADHL